VYCEKQSAGKRKGRWPSPQPNSMSLPPAQSSATRRMVCGLRVLSLHIPASNWSSQASWLNPRNRSIRQYARRVILFTIRSPAQASGVTAMRLHGSQSGVLPSVACAVRRHRLHCRCGLECVSISLRPERRFPASQSISFAVSGRSEYRCAGEMNARRKMPNHFYGRGKPRPRSTERDSLCRRSSSRGHGFRAKTLIRRNVSKHRPSSCMVSRTICSTTKSRKGCLWAAPRGARKGTRLG